MNRKISSSSLAYPSDYFYLSVLGFNGYLFNSSMNSTQKFYAIGINRQSPYNFKCFVYNFLKYFLNILEVKNKIFRFFFILENQKNVCQKGFIVSK